MSHTPHRHTQIVLNPACSLLVMRPVCAMRGSLTDRLGCAERSSVADGGVAHRDSGHDDGRHGRHLLVLLHGLHLHALGTVLLLLLHGDGRRGEGREGLRGRAGSESQTATVRVSNGASPNGRAGSSCRCTAPNVARAEAAPWQCQRASAAVAPKAATAQRQRTAALCGPPLSPRTAAPSVVVSRQAI